MALTTSYSFLSTPNTVRPKKLGELLLDSKVINEKQLSVALEEQKKMNSNSKKRYKLGEVLLNLKYIQMPQLHEALLRQHPRSPEETEKLRKLRSLTTNRWNEYLEKFK